MVSAMSCCCAPFVQVPFDLPPFGVLGFHQPPAGGSQVLDRRPQFGGQRGVAQDQGRLRCQALVLGARQRLGRLSMPYLSRPGPEKITRGGIFVADRDDYGGRQAGTRYPKLG